MAVYNITGYFNTGFGDGNIPDSPSVLRLAQSKTFPSNWLLQDRDLATTRISATWAEVENIDYVQIGNTYYFVTGIKMQTEVCAELALAVDGMTTAGGVGSISIISGWCKRAHTGNDTLFGNNIPEPFQPSKELVVDGTYHYTDTAQGNNASSTTFVASTVDLSKIELLADEYTNTDNQVVCYVPSMPPAAKETYVTLRGSTSAYGANIPNTTLYVLNPESTAGEKLLNAIKTLRSLGLDSAITGCYVVPKMWCSVYIDTETMAVKYIVGVGSQFSCKIPYSYANVRNKKIFSLFNKYTIVSTATGNSTTLDAHTVYHGDASPQMFATSNPAPEGYPVMQFLYNEGRKTLSLENGVVGGTWLNAPLSFGQVSGSLIRQQQFSNRQALATVEQQYNYGKQQASGLLGFIGDVATGNIGGAVNKGVGVVDNAVQNEFKNQQRMIEQAEFSTSQNIVAPEIQFPQGVVNQMLTRNGFLIYRVRLADADVVRLDKFLTMFGYAQSKVLEKSDFTNRQYFNYVQADGVAVGGNVGYRLRANIAAQLSGGVRVWHTLPNPSYYNNNPIR